MVLSSEQFEQIVGRTEPVADEEDASRIMLPDGTFAAERRKETRIPFGQRARIRVQPFDQNPDWSTVMLQDISQQSISFLYDKEISINIGFTLCLKDQAGKLVTLRCSVRRCEAGGFGGTSFAVAAHFDELLDEFPESPTSTGGNGSNGNISDPFEAYGSSSPHLPQAKQRHNGVSRVLSSFNPAKLWSHLTKEYDDFSTSGSGSKLTDDALSEIARTMTDSLGQPNAAPTFHAIEAQPTKTARRSSIFLYADPITPSAFEATPDAAPNIVQSKTEIPNATEPMIAVPVETTVVEPKSMNTAILETVGIEDIALARNSQPVVAEIPVPAAEIASPAVVALTPVTVEIAQAQIAVAEQPAMEIAVAPIPQTVEPAPVIIETTVALSLSPTAPVTVPAVAKASVVEAAAPVKPNEPGETESELLEFTRWTKRSLAGKRYVYMWAAELNVDSNSDAAFLLILMGATENGQPELIALHPAAAVSPAAWKQVLVNLMRRGLTKPPQLAIGDRGLGFWAALADFSPATVKQFAWDSQIPQLLHLLPKGLRRLAEKELREIITIANRENAIKAIDLLAQDVQTDVPEAADRIQQDKSAMLAFHDFPAEFHAILRTNGPIQSLLAPTNPSPAKESKPLQATLADLWKRTQPSAAKNPGIAA